MKQCSAGLGDFKPNFVLYSKDKNTGPIMAA